MTKHSSIITFLAREGYFKGWTCGAVLKLLDETKVAPKPVAPLEYDISRNESKFYPKSWR